MVGESLHDPGEFKTLMEALAFPRLATGGTPSYETVTRWARRGLKARDGRIIKLEHVRKAGRIFTTEAACNRFLDEVAAVPGDSPAPAEPAPIPQTIRTERAVSKLQRQLRKRPALRK